MGSTLRLPLALVLCGAVATGCRHGGWIVPFAVGVAVAESAHAPPDPYAGPIGQAPPDEAEPDDDAGDEEAAQAPPEALPPGAPLDQAAAERQLAPYGRWVDTPEYGRVWIPAGVDGEWQPYADGRWVWTSFGWSFVSGLPWGGIAFHYGRWGWDDDWGWFWVPGYVWGPAWVSWRWAPGYVIWSALGPRGYHYGRHWRGWVTVPHGQFGHHTLGVRVPHAAPIVRSARPVRSPSHAFAGQSHPGHVGHSGGGRGGRR